MFYFLTFIIGVGVAVGGYFIWRHLRRRALLDSLQLVPFLIKIPKEQPTEKTDFKVEINKTEQLLSNLLSFKRPFVFEVAVPHIGEEIHFYIAVPRAFAESTAKQIQGIWNNASVSSNVDDYNIFNPQGATVGGYLALKESYVLPIRTYTEIGADSFSSILGGFSKLNAVGEGAVMQLVVAPTDDEPRNKVLGYVRALKNGVPLKKALGHELPLQFEQIASAFNPEKEQKEKQEKVVDDDAIKALEAKSAKPLFKLNIRFLTSANSPFQAEDIFDGLTGGLTQFASPRRNSFKIVKPRDTTKLTFQFSFRKFENSQSIILNTEEIASLFHLPISTTETPKVKWLKAKEASPPNSLPTAGTLIGHTVFRGQSQPVYITDEDRRRHIYLIGQTGTGKSTAMGDMILEDIKRGRGVAIIDPHGELAEVALAHVPKERFDDLIYFDPSDFMRPMGLNMLDFNFQKPEEKTFIVNEMQSIFNKLFPPETMGPMFEQYMRNALLLLMEDMPNEPATLIEVPRVFTDAEFRKRKLARIHNPVVIDFWEKEASKAGGDASLNNMTPYITSKFNNFISNDYMRPIIGQAKSSFNFRTVMDEGKILLVNLSKGKIGDINANLLGMVFTGKLLLAALSRTDVASGERRDFNLYIDEFQNFTTDSIATILSEARKYKLTLTMAHQFIAQLTENIKGAVFGNVGSQIVFRVGVTDAEFLVKQFEPVFNQNDLINIDNFNAYAKILINGETSQPFNLEIEKSSWKVGDPAIAAKLKEYSRLKYGKDRHVIEDEIYKRLRG